MRRIDLQNGAINGPDFQGLLPRISFRFKNDFDISLKIDESDLSLQTIGSGGQNVN